MKGTNFKFFLATVEKPQPLSGKATIQSYQEIHLIGLVIKVVCNINIGFIDSRMWIALENIYC